MDTDSLLTRVRGFAAPLLPPGARVLAAVSGGSDSVALLRLLAELRGELRIGGLEVAHVNHGLRPGECDDEEAFVQRLAGECGARFHCTRLSGKAITDPGVEAWARAERYAFFHKVMREQGCQVIATGHTLDDQAETVLLRLTRGCGVVGLAGIHAARRDGVVRPILCARREELRQYLAARGQAWCLDPSNDDPRFARNRIRAEVLPALERSLPGSVERIAGLALMVQPLLGRLYVVVNKWLAEHVVRQGPERFEIARKGLAGRSEAPEAVAALLRRERIALSRPHVEAVLRLGTEGRGEHLLPGGWRAVAGPESVLLVRGEAAAPERPEFRYEVAVPGTTVCGSRASFRTEVVAAGPALDPRSRDNLAVVLDAGAGIPGLEYRNWRPEDRFWPLGGQAAETVRDFLKAQGLAAGERAAVGVVAAPGGEVVWIPGFRVAEGRRVTAKTCTVVRAECTWLSQ